MRIDHLCEDEQRVLRLAVNRLAEKGEWNLDELKIEFEELILTDAPIEISGFALDEIDQIVLGGGATASNRGRSRPSRAVAVARVGDVFELGPHRVICGDATDPDVLAAPDGGDGARSSRPDRRALQCEDRRQCHRRRHREFAMASGEMTDDEFLAFNVAWMAAALPCLCDGGVFGTFIDWRGYPTVHSAAAANSA